MGNSVLWKKNLISSFILSNLHPSRVLSFLCRRHRPPLVNLHRNFPMSFIFFLLLCPFFYFFTTQLLFYIFLGVWRKQKRIRNRGKSVIMMMVRRLVCWFNPISIVIPDHVVHNGKYGNLRFPIRRHSHCGENAIRFLFEFTHSCFLSSFHFSSHIVLVTCLHTAVALHENRYSVIFKRIGKEKINFFV